MTARLFIIYYIIRSIGAIDGYYIRPNGQCIRPSIDVSRSCFRRLPANFQMTVDSENKIDQALELLNGDDPCWQNMLDDDCSMGNIYAANFVASKWIQSMPCGEGIEDCDMPSALSSPDARPEAGVDQIDVMKFLGLKRVDSLSKKMP